LGSKAKWEYFRVVYERYRKSARATKKLILDEFCRNTGYNRKYAIRRLNGPPPGKSRSDLGRHGERAMVTGC
jgi:hypothetical protein